MQLNNQNQQKKIDPVSLTDSNEFNRVLMRYGGIFKESIHEYAETILKRNKIPKNYSR